jgi:ubiquitin-protein ligase E3 A
MGLAIYNNIILDVSFPLAIYKLLLFEDPNFDDLKEWQPDIAQSLEYILSYAEETPLEEALGMTFTINVENFGEHVDVELKAGGA